MPTSSLPQYASEEIDEMEDDCEEDEEEEGFSSGAPAAVSSYGKSAKPVVRVGNTVTQQGLGRLSNVATVANLAQTGTLLHHAATGTSAALAPVVAVTGPIGLALACIESGFSAYSAVKTYKHIKALERILLSHGYLAKPGTEEAIVFACKKKNKKLKRKGLGCIPILGSICNSVYTLGRTIQKKIQGTKGVERRQMASLLWGNTLIFDQCAVAACKELLGIKIFAMIEGLADGHLVLEKKLKSL